jgi:excinuclease ABC subunit C
LGLSIPMIGLKKNDKHQLEAIVYQNVIYPIDKSSYLYTYLGKMSNEVHRFAISFHKQTRAKALIRSQLDGIIGIGEKRKTKLLETFVTIDAMKQGDIETYKNIGINETLRERIITHLTLLEKKATE